MVKLYIVRVGKNRIERIGLSTLIKKLNKNSFNARLFRDKEVAKKYQKKEQEDFNDLFRHLPKGFEEQSHLTQHMVLCIMSELDEILNTIHWKHHRNISIKPNPQQTLFECVDVFKYLITIIQAWGFTEKDFIEAFWKKSMVVRQRRSEEFLKNAFIK